MRKVEIGLADRRTTKRSSKIGHKLNRGEKRAIARLARKEYLKRIDKSYIRGDVLTSLVPLKDILFRTSCQTRRMAITIFFDIYPV